MLYTITQISLNIKFGIFRHNFLWCNLLISNNLFLSNYCRNVLGPNILAIIVLKKRCHIRHDMCYLSFVSMRKDALARNVGTIEGSPPFSFFLFPALSRSLLHCTALSVARPVTIEYALLDAFCRCIRQHDVKFLECRKSETRCFT